MILGMSNLQEIFPTLAVQNAPPSMVEKYSIAIHTHGGRHIMIENVRLPFKSVFKFQKL